MCELIHVVSAYAFWVCPTYVNLTNCSQVTPSGMLGPSFAPSPLQMFEPSSSPSFAPSPLQMFEPSPTPSPTPLQMSEPSPSPLQMFEPSPTPSPTPSPLQMPEPSSAPLFAPSPYRATKYALKNGFHTHNTTNLANTTFNTTMSNEPEDTPGSKAQNLDVLHVLWTIPITGVILILKMRSKSAQIKAGWQGRKMKRSQSWHGTPRRKSPISSRWKSEPLQVSDFDGINAIA